MKQLSKKANNFLKQAGTAIAVFFSRFGFLAANFSPLGSFGFLSQNLFLYAATILLFDLLKGGFYPGFLFTYLGFLAYWLFGKIAKTQKLKLILLPVASLSFFLLSNLGVWWNFYPHNLIGLTSCYLLAIPFYSHTLLGDLVFGYGFMGLKSLMGFLKENKISLATS